MGETDPSPSVLRRAFPRSVALICLLLLVAQAALLVTLARDAQVGEPRDLPVAVVSAPAMAQSLADQANAMEGSPFDAYVGRDAHAVEASVRRGTTAAGLDVDLRVTEDVLVLNEANGERLNQAIRDRVEAFEDSYGRSVVVETVDTAQGSPHSPDVLALLAHAVAFAFVVIVSLALGPVTRTLGRGVLRHVVLVGVAVVAGLLLGFSPLAGDAPGVKVAVVLALAVLVVGSAVLALEALAGLAGLGIATAVFFVQIAPLLLQVDTRLLPAPWRSILQATPVGAMERALADLIIYDDAPGITRYVFVLAAWLVVALLTSLVARRVRDRAGVDLHTTGGPARRTKSVWRLRVAAVVVPATALLLALTLLVPRTAVAGPETVPSRASETKCVETGPVRDLADLNRITDRLRGHEEFQRGFQGGDVGASVELQDGRRLFLFGDTLRAADFDGQRFVRNSMLVMEPGCLQVVTPEDHGAVIPDRDDGVGYWPMSVNAVHRQGYDLVAVTAQRVRTTGSDAFDFENLGPAIVLFVVPRGGTPQLIDRVDIGADDPDRTQPTWGAASAVHDDWVYFYGTANPGEELVFGYSLSVARVRAEDALDRTKWRFWNGAEWVRDESSATELIPAEGGVSQTLSVFERGGTWYALSKRDEFLGTDLTVWTAPSPTGPFTAQAPLAQLPSDAVSGELRYMPLAHPGLLPEPGTMVVSYSRNRTDLDQVIADPMRYRPRFLRVTLP